MGNSLKEGYQINDEISLSELFLTLRRFKKIIFAFSFIGIIVGGLIGINTKKVWQGEFQIVVETSKDKLSSLTNNLPISVVNQEQKKLATQIQILSSPSILMDIFEFVK